MFSSDSFWSPCVHETVLYIGREERRRERGRKGRKRKGGRKEERNEKSD